jgi:hypothetical protein
VKNKSFKTLGGFSYPIVQLQLFPFFELFGLFLSQIRLHGKFCPRQAQGFLVVHLHPPELNIVLKFEILASKPKPVKQIRATKMRSFSCNLVMQLAPVTIYSDE